MRTVQICIRRAGKYQELPLDDVDRAEAEIEDLVSHILLEFFEEILVDDVSIIPLAGEQGDLIRIRARCTINSAPLQVCDDDFLSLTLEGSVSCTLAELLGEVDVKQVSVRA